MLMDNIQSTKNFQAKIPIHVWQQWEAWLDGRGSLNNPQIFCGLLRLFLASPESLQLRALFGKEETLLVAEGRWVAPLCVGVLAASWDFLTSPRYRGGRYTIPLDNLIEHALVAGLTWSLVAGPVVIVLYYATKYVLIGKIALGRPMRRFLYWGLIATLGVWIAISIQWTPTDKESLGPYTVSWRDEIRNAAANLPSLRAALESAGPHGRLQYPLPSPSVTSVPPLWPPFA